MSSVYVFIPEENATVAMYNRSFTKSPRRASFIEDENPVAYLVFGISQESLALTTIFDNYEWLSEDEMRSALSESLEEQS